MPRHDLKGTIKILGSEIPDELAPKIRAGYIALTKLEGRTYEEFRKKVGSKPTPEDRPYSPSTVIKHAIEHGYAKLESTDRHRNPTWVRDELILALDLYLKHREALPANNSLEILRVSATLNRLGMTIFGDRSDTFRNPNGVYLKLMNFRSLDPDYTRDGRVGMQRRGKGDEEVWREFAGHPEACHKAARTILSALDELEDVPTLAQYEYPDDSFTEAAEGRTLTRLHLVRERNRKLVEKKKLQRREEAGCLECEACGFDFEAKYGKRGAGFIEAHHVKPVSELAPGEKTHLDDLILLCSNCHRMVHAKRPWFQLDELRKLIGRD